MDEEIKKSGEKSEREIIKNAVGGGIDEKEELFVPTPGSARMFGDEARSFGGERKESFETSRGYEGMQPSILGQEQENNQQTISQDIPQETSGYPVDYNQQSYQGSEQESYGAYGTEQQYSDYPQGYGAEQQYQPYQEAMSSDVITEISEQVVDERMSAMRDKLEKAIDFRNLAEVKINGIDRRLRRIEQIIDILQVSLIQKVSEYVTDVKDVKNELVETQKSFKAIAPHLKHHAQHAEHHSPHSIHHSHPHHLTHYKHKRNRKKHAP